MERTNRDDVAVFVDFENVYVSVREKFDAQPNFELIMDRCEDYGRIVIARAYADWYRYPRVTSALFANGVEPMYVPTYYYDRDMGRTGRPIKNSVDIHLCIDAMRTLYSQPNIVKYVLVTGDRDFIPLVNAIRQHGKDVIIIGIGGAASAHLAQSADEFLFYEQIADLKSPTQQRERERAPEDGRRTDERRERGERQERGRPERQPRPAPAAPAPVAEPLPEPVLVEAPDVPDILEPPETPAEKRSPYDTLVDAVKLARQRGFVVNLGSLKVVMRELDSSFHESKVKDANGRGFTKFKDFVKEAERQNKVLIFTNGTVTEIFLHGEDPYRLSQFAEDLASERAERELETELDTELEQEARQAEAAPTPEEVTVVPTEAADELPAEELAAAIGVADEELTTTTGAAGEEAVATVGGTDEPAVQRTFGDREWEVFRGSMTQFNEPVRFAEIFNALRGLRNQEVMELTNNELKELVKQAINRGMLQRTGRGARAYYRLSSQYRVTRPEGGEFVEQDAPSTAGQPLGEAPEAIGAAPAPDGRPRPRRARLYGEAAPAATNGNAPELVAPEPIVDTAVTAAIADEPEPAVVEPAAEAAPVEAPAPSSAAKRRSRRKPAAAPAADESAGAAAPAQETAPAPEASAEAAPATSSRRRRKPAAAAEPPAEEEQAAPSAQQNGARKRRRRKKPANGDGADTGEES